MPKQIITNYFFVKTALLNSFVFFLFCLLHTNVSLAQCPEITNVTFTPDDGSFVCPGEQIMIEVEGENFPQGTIDWYIEPATGNIGFNPYEGEGTMIGSSDITPIDDPTVVDICEPCPEIVAIMIDACNGNNGTGNEYDNEFLLLTSGGGISSADQIQIDLDGNNNVEFGGQTPGVNNDINFGNAPCDFLNAPNPSVIAGLQSSFNCNNTNIIPAGPSTMIPAGALVVVFMSNNTNTNYDFDGLCANGETVYVLQSSCPRTAGAFSNSSSNGCRTYNVFIGDCSQCDSQITYNTANGSNESTSGLGGYAYIFDENGNGQIDYTSGCSSNEIIHHNGVPCEAPPVETIPIPGIPSEVQTFTYNTPFLDCGATSQTFFIKGIINPLYDICLDNPFNPDYTPYTVGPYIFTVEAETPALETPPQICVGQSLTLDDLVIDINQYSSSGWLDNSDPFLANQLDVFTPVVTGTYDFYFFPLNSGGTCYTYGCISIEVVDGLALQLGTATVCQSETNYDLSQLEDPNNPDGTWTIDGDNTPLNDIFDASGFSAGDVTLNFEPSSSNGSSCATTTRTTITITEPPTLNPVSSNDLDCTNTTATLSSGITDSDYSYQWNGPAINALNNPLAEPEINLPGTYTVTVTDTNNCSSEATIMVSQNSLDLPDVGAQVSGAIQCNTPTVELQGNSTTATQFKWTDPMATLINEQNPTVSIAGTYTLIVTNASGCTNSTTIDVQIDTIAPTIDILLSNDIDCNNPEASLFGNSPQTNIIDTYEWFLDDISFNNQQNITTTQTGEYTLLVTDINGCTNTAQTTIAIDTLSPNASITPVTDILDCNTPEIFLQGNSTTPMVSFSWDAPSGTLLGSSPPANTAGVYTLIVTASNGCTSTDSVEVTTNETLPDIDIEALEGTTLNCNQSSITLTGITTTPNTDFEWDTPNGTLTDASINADIAGVYTVTVINTTDGCSNSASITIIEDTTLPQNVLTGSGSVFCSPSTVTITASSEDENDTYEWFDENTTLISTTAEATFNTAGIYTVVVTGPNGCTATATSTITEDTSPPQVSTQDAVLNCGGTPVNLTADSPQNVNYAWSAPDGSPFSNEANPIVTTTGTYTLLVTDENSGCTATATAEVTGATDLPSASINISNELDCNNTEATLTAITDIDNPVFAWADALGNSIGTTMTINASQAGDYVVTISDAAGVCSNTASAILTGTSNIPVASITLSNIIDCNNNTATLTAQTFTTNPAFTWTDETGEIVSEDMVFTTSTTGTFTLEVTDLDTGCSSSVPQTVSSSMDIPSVSITGNNLIDCDNTMVTLEATSTTSDASFSWTNSNNELVSDEGILNTSITDTYTLVVTDNTTGCSNSEIQVVSAENDIPSFTAQISNAIDCTNTEATAILSTSITNPTFVWRDENGDIVANESTFTTNQSGIYDVTMTNSDNNCSTTQSVTILDESTNPIVTIMSENTVLDCDITSVVLTGETNATNPIIEWLDETNTVISNELETTVNTSGLYTLVISEGGCNDQAQITVLQNGDIPSINDIQITGNDNILDCDTDMIEITGFTDDNVTFSWSGPNDFTANTATIFAPEAGDYTLTITSPISNCASEQTFTVFNDFAPPALTTENTTLDCSGVGVPLIANTVTPNLNYEWSGPNDFSSSAISPMVNTAGAYQVTITSTNNGCTNEATAQVFLNEGTPSLSATASIIDCQNSSTILDGSASTPAGDSISYQWYFNNQPIGNTNELTPTASEAGDYELIGINTNNQCADTLDLTVNIDTISPIVNATSNDLINCIQTNATLDASTSSGQGNLNYEWYDENNQLIAQTANTTTITGGIFQIIITDSQNGCTASSTVEIPTDTVSPQVILLPHDDITCLMTTTTLIADVPTNSNYSLQWFDTNNTELGTMPIQDVQDAGIYSIQITNTDNGCTNSSSVTIMANNQAPNVAIAIPDNITCIQSQVILDASASETGSNIEILWQSMNAIDSPNTLTPSVSEAGQYELVLTNTDNGCSDSDIVEVLLDQTPPDAVASSDGGLGCNSTDVDLLGVGSSEGNTFTYAWSGPSIDTPLETLNINVTEVGTYTLLVTNTDNGCTNEANINITEDGNSISAPEILTQDENCVGDNNGIIQIGEVTGGTPPYLYAIDGENLSTNAQFINLAPGIYPLLIQDAEGCEWQETLTIQAATPLYVELGENEIIQLGDDVQLNLQTNAVIDTVLWSDTNLTGTSPTVAPNNTTTIDVTVMDINGCTESDAITIIIDRTRPVYIPNAFSPNADGTNDVFMIYGTDAIEMIHSFQVYDRWGELVFSNTNFQANDPMFGWDGNLGTKALNPAVFVYYAEIEFKDGIVEIFKGDVTLVK